MSLGKAIVITSGKGGVGKTTTTASIGAALAQKGKKTLIIDADIGLRNLDVIMGLENRIVFNLVDVIKGTCKAAQAVIKSKKSPNLFLLPASQTDDKDAVNTDQMKKLITELKEEYQFIIIDSPAGIEAGFRNACAGADEAIIVCTPEVSSIRDADRVIGLLAAQGLEAKLIINRIDKDMVKKGDMLSPQDVIDILGVEQIGLILKDNEVIIAANNGEPCTYNPKSKAGEAFMRVADRIIGADIPAEDLNLVQGFWEKLGRKLRAA